MFLSGSVFLHLSFFVSYLFFLISVFIHVYFILAFWAHGVMGAPLFGVSQFGPIESISMVTDLLSKIVGQRYDIFHRAFNNTLRARKASGANKAGGATCKQLHYHNIGQNQSTPSYIAIYHPLSVLIETTTDSTTSIEMNSTIPHNSAPSI